MKFLSTLMTDARGKVGNVVASKNRGGNYFRNRVIPKNPKSTSQVERRLTLSNGAKDWSHITDTQRAGWNQLATTFTRSDALGNKIHQSGEQLFVGCYANAATANIASPGDAPATPDAPTALNFASLVIESANGGGTGETFTVASAAPTAGQAIFIYVTAPFSAGRSFIGKSQYRLIKAQLHADTSPVDILAAYTAKFGHLAAGAKVSVKLISISANGFASAPFTQTVVVTAHA